MYPFSQNISWSRHIRASMVPPPPLKKQQQPTTKKKILKTKNQQTTIVKKWSLNASFASVLEGEPVPSFFFFLYFGNSLTHPYHRDWYKSTSPYGSGLTCSFWIRDWQCSMYYYGYDLICTPEGNISFFIFIFFFGGGWGAEPPPTGGEPLPKFENHIGPYTHPVDFWLTFGPATES